MTFRVLSALSVAALLVMLPAAAGHAQRAVASARIRFAKTEHDFGNLAFSSMGYGWLEFTNTGRAPLLVTGVKSTCACLTAEWPSNPVAPGGKAMITFKSTPQMPGPFQKTMTVSSNAAATPVLVLAVRARAAVAAH